MDLVISISIMAVVVCFSLYVMNKSEKRKIKTVQNILETYEDNCRYQCKTTREVTDRFMEVSEKQVGSIMELHKKTLELLSGEKIDV